MPISAPKVSLARVDALCVYTLVLAQCLALQVVKDAQTLTWHVTGAWRALPTVALALAVLRAHARPGDTRSALALAAAGLLALTVNGSQSNHVLLELALCAATLLAAPGGCFSRSAARRDASRRAFSSALTDSTRALLAVLYLSTGFAKLNDDWHDPKQSCCVQMFVGALAGCGLAPATAAALAPAPARELMPVGATAFELAFGIALVRDLLTNGWTRERRLRRDGYTDFDTDSVTTRTFAILGGAFHALIALPPPPMSVYPFSMLMAPPYVAGLVPHSVTSAARAFARCQDEIKIASAIFLSAALAHQYQTALERDASLFEYPAYFAWRVGVAWTVAAFFAVAAAARRGVVAEGGENEDGGSDEASPASANEHESEPSTNRNRREPTFVNRLIRRALPALFVATVSAAPYVGARTYPAFAMFSNLRVEGGGETNHWVVRSIGTRFPIAAGDDAYDAYDAYARAYGPDVAVRVEATDLPSLRDAQINLAPLFPDSVKRALRLTDVTPEFLIAPPRWGPRYDNPEAPKLGSRARPVTLPLAEARRRVSAALAEAKTARDGNGASFFVKFRWVAGGVAEARATEFRVKNGEIARSVKGRDAVLGAPLPWWRALVHRYRAFDLDASPCRH
jgi:hypothetical protein